MISGHRLGLLAASLAVLLILTLEASPAAGATAKACRVRNTKTGQTYTRLQQAVKAAKPGVRLVVSGTCPGSTVIAKRILLTGKPTPRRGRPILDGEGETGVLRIRGGVRVTIRDLTIQHGQRAGRFEGTHFVAFRGGGILNYGKLKLRNVVVRRNQAQQGTGTGIYNAGTLRLRGASAVRENGPCRGSCYAIYNDGTVIMKDASRINRNRGTGVFNAGTLTMHDSSRITRNRPPCSATQIGGEYGGGVDNRGALTMNDSSHIRGNQAVWGGGVHNVDALTMNDSSSITGNRASHRFPWCPRGARRRVGLHSHSGGVLNDAGVLTMTGASVIRDNRAARTPGGLFNDDDYASLVGVTCGPGGNVYGNTPDDCNVE